MPKITIFSNPKRKARRPIVLSTRAVSLAYWHADPSVDGRLPYEHAFAAGVTVQLLPDGSVRLYRPDGKPLFRKFR